MEKTVRSNPPASVRSIEEHERYRTLYDDITTNAVVIQYADRHALGELACMLCLADELRKELRENGSSMEVTGDRAIITKKNPAGDLLLRLGPQIKAMLNEFKMTPNSRGKTFAGVGETDKTAGDDWDKL